MSDRPEPSPPPGRSHRWQMSPVLLLAAGVCLVWGSALASGAALGWWWVGLIVGGLLVIASTAWFRRRLTEADLERRHGLEELAQKRREQKLAAEQFEERRKDTEQQLEKIAASLQTREETLANRLVTYHEWMEFPRPINLDQDKSSDALLTDLAKKDKQLLKLLEDESKSLFEKIRQNRYMEDNKFQPDLLRNDALDLVQRVIDIYRPGGKERLLETSLAQIFRAVSRASIQFMVVLDHAPVDVQEYNIRDLYNYVQRAVKAYGYYKRVEPYWPYLNSAFYLGRFAMGANPITLGAWWVLGSLSSRGIRAIAEKVVNQQAMLLLHNVIRVIGFETAAIYGGEFRHRDANWMYGAELAEMMSRFPTTRESLVHALKEVGSLQLRNEYDRVFLYRAIASHQTANPERYRARVVLSNSERRVIAERLEKFCKAFLHPVGEETAKWRDGVEHRLGVQLHSGGAKPYGSESEQCIDALRSQASFLLAFKEREPEDLEALLVESAAWKELDEASRQKVRQDLSENPPFFFEQPDLEPGGRLAEQYLADIVRLSADVKPPSAPADEAYLEAAAWLRVDEAAARSRLAKEYNARLSAKLPPEAPRRKLPLAAARAVLTLALERPPLLFVYPAQLQITEDEKVRQIEAWLLGVEEEALLLAIDPEPQLLWRGRAPLPAQRLRGVLSSTCELNGGQLTGDVIDPAACIHIAGPTIGSYSSYFKPLHDFCQG
ncbi:hypothetical protein [Lignipirellula cremea]|uniref:Uncharacterized protein n=1 Tax=Lignipirellula cremea TaxID=2528010 RepID=A0A518DR91_9BACT|nr:hypothetical protein [Lignipirellula cremea]QDU94351.1 hypothetical protein Pla8534_21400 [Lignipirellula cremea]